MKLTILRLNALSQQDLIDLAKIWPQPDIEPAALIREDHRQLFVARFNDRLLGALLLEVHGTGGNIMHLKIREVTQRRGVGRYLLEETIAQNPDLTAWRVADDGSASAEVRAAFMQACGFYYQEQSWIKDVSGSERKPT